VTTIRNEIRKNDQGEPEVWMNFGDLLDWLDTLPTHAKHPVAAGASQDIKKMLLDEFATALDQLRG
jgi:hypothetical protein